MSIIKSQFSHRERTSWVQELVREARFIRAGAHGKSSAEHVGFYGSMFLTLIMGSSWFWIKAYESKDLKECSTYALAGGLSIPVLFLAGIAPVFHGHSLVDIGRSLGVIGGRKIKQLCSFHLH